jgi:ankyrin repeat protein
MKRTRKRTTNKFTNKSKNNKNKNLERIKEQNNEKQTPINILFNYVRNHEWTKFKNLLESDDTIDINTRDNQTNYLLTYAIRFNKIDIVELLLKRGAKYDIVDRSERSILYDVIESNYHDILLKLLDHSAKNIGIMITDIRDLNGNIPLHYAIKFKNIEAAKLLMQHKSNAYITDIDGYNALHLAVRSGSLEIVGIIVSTMSVIDTKTFRGETALHISINFQYGSIAELLLNAGADPNIVDSENEFSPLHYAVGWNSLDIIDILLKKGSNPNLQDIYGNTPLFYCIKEDYASAFDKITNSKNKINFNLWNIDGKIILHEVLENYEETKKHYIDALIQDSNLSTQDGNGNTCMHYLVLYDLWKEYKDILKKKKINIFAKNSNGNAVIDLIFTDDKHNKSKLSDYNNFLDIITEGYIYLLRKSKKEWPEELDKICSRDLSDLTDEEKNYIAYNISDKVDKNNKKRNNQNENIVYTEKDIYTGCFMLIRNKLVGDIKKYREGKLEYCQRSYPVYKKQCIHIEEDVVLDVCTFTGSLLDVLMGLIFLIKKHGSIVCTTLGKNNVLSSNEELCNFYKSMGLIMNGRCEFLNFEIVWIDYKLYIIEKFSELFNLCINSEARFVIIPLGIELKTGSHANYLIYDKSLKEIERFEPHGGTTPIGFNYNTQFLDEILEEYFKSIDKDIQYIKPSDYIPKIGFQIMDSQEEHKRRIGDPGGFCALWSIWYVDQRLTYYTYDRKTLVKELFKNIKVQSISYRNMIRNYSRNIIKQRDELLKIIDIDINDWLNENYTYTQLDKFNAALNLEINNCCIVK